MGGLGPSGGDDFAAGVEGDAFGSANVLVAEGVVGRGTLMPIMPTLTERWNLRAEAPEEVKIAVPLP